MFCGLRGHTLAREGVDDLLLDTLLALGQAFILQAKNSAFNAARRVPETYFADSHDGVEGKR